jgi:hypothetical protein
LYFSSLPSSLDCKFAKVIGLKKGNFGLYAY